MLGRLQCGNSRRLQLDSSGTSIIKDQPSDTDTDDEAERVWIEKANENQSDSEDEGD